MYCTGWLIHELYYNVYHAILKSASIINQTIKGADNDLSWANFKILKYMYMYNIHEQPLCSKPMDYDYAYSIVWYEVL